MSAQKFTIPVLVALLVCSIVAALYFYQASVALKVNPSVAAQKDVEALVARVGKLIELPEGETPTVVTVSDPEKLKDQPFFAKAKAGDKVLLYSTAQKAYLYDPVTNKIVEVAPINLGTGATKTATTTPVSR